MGKEGGGEGGLKKDLNLRRREKRRLERTVQPAAWDSGPGRRAECGTPEERVRGWGAGGEQWRG